MMKLVVDQASDRVLGCHMVGEDAAEMIQGFAVALTAGATKAEFRRHRGAAPDGGRGIRHHVPGRTPARAASSTQKDDERWHATGSPIPGAAARSQQMPDYPDAAALAEVEGKLAA